MHFQMADATWLFVSYVFDMKFTALCWSILGLDKLKGPYLYVP